MLDLLDKNTSLRLAVMETYLKEVFPSIQIDVEALNPYEAKCHLTFSCAEDQVHWLLLSNSQPNLYHNHAGF
jgi:hypothetical protein